MQSGKMRLHNFDVHVFSRSRRNHAAPNEGNHTMSETAGATRKVARKLTMASASSLSTSEKAKLGVDKATPILQVIGMTNEYKFGETQLGPYIKFWGQFEAVDLMTGEITTSGAAIFPPILGDNLVGAIGKDGNTVRFAGTFGVKPASKKDATIPWEYYFDVKVNPNASDALADLRKMMPGASVAKAIEDKSAAKSKGSK